MLNPIGNNAALPQPLTLVATPLPNSNALRVPYDNVAPSVSNAQLDNNASSNRNYLPKTESSQTAPLTTSSNENFSLAALANSTSFSASAQTTFLAQLASGDFSPEARSLFAQYDKLVSYANVKYKPSNAGKPTEPVSLFGEFLKQDVQQQVEFILPPPEPTAQIEVPVASAEAILSTEPQIHALQSANDTAMPQVQAYSAAIARNLDVTTSDVEIA